MDTRDPEAFRALYREHHPTIRRFLSARAPADQVDDLAAETFLVAWRRAAELPPHTLPWLLNVAAKVLATHRRKSERAGADTTPELFEDEPDPFGSIAKSAPSVPVAVGDLPALLTSALGGMDPNVRLVGRTTVRGIDVDQIRIEHDVQMTSSTAHIVRDVYVRHDNALPVRVVDQLGAFSTSGNTTTISDFTDTQKLTLDASTEPALQLSAHPGAKRTVRPPFDRTLK